MLSEQGLIERILAPLTGAGDGALGLRDDAATIAVDGAQDLVVTMDTLIADGHFRKTDPPDLIARKALRVNLSDLAAKGAEPVAYFLSLGLPGDIDEVWLQSFATGLAEDQKTFAITLHGGDTVRVPERLTLTVTAIGRVPRDSMVRRDGARAGDCLYVTGTIGDGTLGLRAGTGTDLPGLAEVHRQFLAERFLLPCPRLQLVPALRAHAHAAMDISDGLVGDAGLLCKASGVTARIDRAAVPLSAAARAAVDDDPALLDTVLTGGDDYEILCAVPRSDKPAFETMAGDAGLAVTVIGEVEAGQSPPRVIEPDGSERKLAHLSYAHF